MTKNHEGRTIAAEVLALLADPEFQAMHARAVATLEADDEREAS